MVTSVRSPFGDSFGFDGANFEFAFSLPRGVSRAIMGISFAVDGDEF